MFFKKDVYPRSKFKPTDKLLAKLKELMIICRENLHHAQKLQKRAHNKGVKPRNYAFSDKVWLNSKYIKTKQNRKLKAKFFKHFQVLHLIGKQAYKLKLLKKWRIHDVFYVLLLEQDTTRKRRVDENNAAKLDVGDNEGDEYKVEAICNSAVYAKESETSHLPGLYYLVFWKSYPEEENTLEPPLAVQHLRKLISLFYKNHLNKLTAISKAINIAPLIARPTIRPTVKPIKQKQG